MYANNHKLIAGFISLRFIFQDAYEAQPISAQNFSPSVSLKLSVTIQRHPEGTRRSVKNPRMNRFKTSKYKNTIPKISKKNEWISNVRGSSFNSQSNQIKSSCSLVAFNTDQAVVGMVGICSLDPGPDGKRTVTQIPCHADQVTDLDFSPFDDYLLATCSADEMVKLWRLCDPGQEQPLTADASLNPGEGGLELLLFHPTAAGLLAVGSSRGIQVWDTSRHKALAVLEQHKEQLHGLAWKEDGSLLASTCKDKNLRIFDLRAQMTAVQCAQVLYSNKDSRVVWVKDVHIITTGLNQNAGDKDTFFHENNLIITVSNLFAAGTDTTSATLRWSLLLMAKYPQFQDCVQEELDRVIGGRQPVVKDRKNLPYTDAVIHEIQRLANIVPMSLPHTTSCDVKFQGYFIKKGTCVLPLLTSVLRDERQWESPETFNPAHFLDEQGQFVKKDAFMPFSAGRRICMGESLAKMELFLFFTSLLQHFRFIPPPGVSEDQLDLTPAVGFTLNPSPYKLCAVIRTS
ncbi:Cytochrome P450 2K1 [Bagarius yarrelli]|uniref:Cytochrome P450 2K1 n=1 Tax=Bagarius yarrelli TaxID=175774 RepID=A0A556TW35_BAGYA|nr:Cytochrome P450 2K1 [Bagarius yarrelli]